MHRHDGAMGPWFSVHAQGARFDAFGLPAWHLTVAVPLDRSAESVVALAATDTAYQRTYRLSMDDRGGSLTVTPVPRGDQQGSHLTIEGCHVALLQWLYDPACLLGHLLTAGVAKMTGDLVRASLVEGWASYLLDHRSQREGAALGEWVGAMRAALDSPGGLGGSE